MQPGKALGEMGYDFTGLEQGVVVARQQFAPAPGNVISLRKPPKSDRSARWDSRAVWEAADEPSCRALCLPLRKGVSHANPFQGCGEGYGIGRFPFWRASHLCSACAPSMRNPPPGSGLRMTRIEMDTFASVTVLSRSRAEEIAAKTAMLECAPSLCLPVKTEVMTAFFCASSTSPRQRSCFGPLAFMRRTPQFSGRPPPKRRSCALELGMPSMALLDRKASMALPLCRSAQFQKSARVNTCGRPKQRPGSVKELRGCRGVRRRRRG